MTSKKKIAAGVIASTSMVLGSMAPGMIAFADQPESSQSEENATAQSSEASVSSAYVESDASQGSASWDQTTLTSNDVIRAIFAKAASALCGSKADFITENPLEWKLKVSGDVSNAYEATVDELAEEQSQRGVMTCTCGGNPADGKAIVTADVEGIPVSYLVQRASAQAGVNAITFISSDGTEVAMPLTYVVGHHAVLSYMINGEDLSASVGGNNQLWITGTSANYFVRDIVEIRITKEDVVPARPGEGMDFPNSPNVGMTSASVE